jgi:hypothetical protein
MRIATGTEEQRMTRRWTVRSPLIAVALSVAVTACGGGGGAPATTPAPSQFSAAIPTSKGVQRFTGIVRALPLGGTVAGDIPITFPM